MLQKMEAGTGASWMVPMMVCSSCLDCSNNPYDFFQFQHIQELPPSPTAGNREGYPIGTFNSILEIIEDCEEERDDLGNLAIGTTFEQLILHPKLTAQSLSLSQSPSHSPNGNALLG